MAKENIMIVEDEAIVGKELRASIEGLGYTVTSVVKTGEKAIKRAIQDRPKLILMDIKLKGQMDGIKAAELIRSSVDIPVIFLTAHADEEKLERAKLTMAFGYILKPFQDKDLKVTIEMGLYAANINAKRRQAEKALLKSHSELERQVEKRTAKLTSINKRLKEAIGVRKQAEKALHESQQIAGAILDNANMHIWAFDGEMYSYFNKEWYRYTGQDKSLPLTVERWTEFIHPDDLDKATKIWLDAWDRKIEHDNYFRLRNSDGEYRLFHCHAAPVFDENGNFQYFQGFNFDITKQKLAEQEIERISVENALILNTAPGMIFWIDKKGIFIRVNDSFAAALHKSKDDINGRSLFELYPEVMAKGFFNDNAVVIESGVPKLSIQEPVETPTGNIWVSTDKIPLKDDKGEIVGVIGFSHDITKLKQTEEELTKSKALLQTVFDGISDPLMMVDKNMKMLLQNRAAMKYYGVPYTTNCFNKECHQVFNGNPDPCEGCDIPLAVSNGRHESFERKGLMNPEKIEQVVIYPMHHKDHREETAIIRISDVTRAKQIERELIQADKMISLGVLVSGVAHEINNPNNFIMLNAPLLKEAWESIVPVLERYYNENGDFSMAGLPYSEMRDELPQLFSGIKEGSKRIKRIVRDLKNFARQDDADMDQSVNINQVIESSIRLVGNMMKKVTKNFRVEYGRNLPLFMGNKQKLEQVMINLIQNACQAIPDKEKGIFLTSSFDKKKGDVVVEVRDEGEGIPKNLLPRIMDPFFTTRRSEGGTGLGLSVSSNIVKGHGGKIEIESEWGKGTAVRFFIPIMRIEGIVKILVVDDDRALRESLHTALGKVEHYIVREASNGVEAFLKIGQEPPDLLVLDVMMPDMDGVEVCRLIKNNPALSAIKVIIITGFAESSRLKEIAGMGFDKILAKPFSIPALLNMADEVLEVQK